MSGWTRSAQQHVSSYEPYPNQLLSGAATGTRRICAGSTAALPVVHDWDSLVAQPEVAIIGAAAAAHLAWHRRSR
jgi:hypothetical protein